MIFNFKKKLPCGKNCFGDFTKQVSNLVTTYSSSINGHITILHSMPYHQIEIVFYSDSMHETKKGNKIITKKFTNPLQKRFKGKLPTKAQLENL